MSGVTVNNFETFQFYTVSVCGWFVGQRPNNSNIMLVKLSEV